VLMRIRARCVSVRMLETLRWTPALFIHKSSMRKNFRVLLARRCKKRVADRYGPRQESQSLHR
jgi:hypothetical protein